MSDGCSVNQMRDLVWQRTHIYRKGSTNSDWGRVIGNWHSMKYKDSKSGSLHGLIAYRFFCRWFREEDDWGRGRDKVDKRYKQVMRIGEVKTENECRCGSVCFFKVWLWGRALIFCFIALGCVSWNCLQLSWGLRFKCKTQQILYIR